MKSNDSIDAEDLRLGKIAKRRFENGKPEDYVRLEKVAGKLGITLRTKRTS